MKACKRSSSAGLLFGKTNRTLAAENGPFLSDFLLLLKAPRATLNLPFFLPIPS